MVLGDEAHVVTVAVDPDRRGEGIGTVLMCVLAHRARALGALRHETLDGRRAVYDRFFRYLLFGNVLRGEEIVIPLDILAGASQQYVEDCPVCCRANVIRVMLMELNRISSHMVALATGGAGCGSAYAVRHTVQQGDTVSAVARRYGVSEAELRRSFVLSSNNGITAVVGPDGSLFVSVGGRGTRGGVFRIYHEAGLQQLQP